MTPDPASYLEIEERGVVEYARHEKYGIYETILYPHYAGGGFWLRRIDWYSCEPFTMTLEEMTKFVSEHNERNGNIHRLRVKRHKNKLKRNVTISTTGLSDSPDNSTVRSH